MLEEVYLKQDKWLSNSFRRPKSNGKYRMIFDLTKLNKLVEYKHFKMFNLNTAHDLITQNCFMASVDLTDAYYALAISSEPRKVLIQMGR